MSVHKNAKESAAVVSIAFYAIAAIGLALCIISILMNSTVNASVAVALFFVSVIAGSISIAHRSAPLHGRRIMKLTMFTVTVVYTMFVIYLTFFGRDVGKYTAIQGAFSDPRDYYMSYYVNFKPLHTINYFYLENLANDSSLVTRVLVNMLGNIFLLAPTALLWPCIMRCMNNFFVYISGVICSSFMIEAIQLWTMRGSCDVDDVILNVFGAVLCFGLMRLPPLNRCIKTVMCCEECPVQRKLKQKEPPKK